MIRAASTPETGEPATAGGADLEQFAHPSSDRDGSSRPVWLARVGPLPDDLLPSPGDLHVPVDPPREEAVTGEIAIATRAVGLDLGDLLLGFGAVADAPKLPGEIGWEVSGVVTRAGGEFQLGDPVMGVIDHGGAPFMGVGDHGGGPEQVIAPADRFVRLPTGWSFEQGAAFPVSYLYAFELLWVMGSARQGTRVLVHGAAGPVGQAVAQIGHALGCELIGTAARDKHAMVEALGVTPIERDDFAVRVRRLTGGRGVDLVLDPVGGDHWSESFRALAPGGRLVAYGPHRPITPSGRSRSLRRVVRSLLRAPSYAMPDLLEEGKGVLGVNLDYVFGDPALLRQRFADILALPGVSPAVGALFPFDEVREALAFLQSGRSIGKVVLAVDPP